MDLRTLCRIESVRHSTTEFIPPTLEVPLAYTHLKSTLWKTCANGQADSNWLCVNNKVIIIM